MNPSTVDHTPPATPASAIPEPPAPAEPTRAHIDTIERLLALEMPLPAARKLLVAEFERRYIERVLAQHGGKVGKAASAAGVAGRYFRLLRARSRESRIPGLR